MSNDDAFKYTGRVVELIGLGEMGIIETFGKISRRILKLFLFWQM